MRITFLENKADAAVVELLPVAALPGRFKLKIGPAYIRHRFHELWADIDDRGIMFNADSTWSLVSFKHESGHQVVVGNDAIRGCSLARLLLVTSVRSTSALQYIVDTYDSLADRTTFLIGSRITMKHLERLMEPLDQSGFAPINNGPCPIEWADRDELSTFLKRNDLAFLTKPLYDIPHENHLFSATRECIRQHPKYVYESLLQNSSVYHDGKLLNKLWKSILCPRSTLPANSHIAVVQYDNRASVRFQKLIAHNALYCRRHGYDHVLRGALAEGSEDPYASISPYWAKVKACLDLLEQHTYDAIVWLDTDAVIWNHSIALEDILQDSTMIFANDTHASFNAGVWSIRGDDLGLKILREWWGLYNPNAWERDAENNWKCAGFFAGEDYEQGSFVTNLFPKYRCHIGYLEAYVLNGDDPYELNSFVLHFYGDRKNRIDELSVDMP
jgi:hypothetical protein